MSKSKASRQRVSKKIEYLIGEGKSPDQAVAMALSMEREGRLTDKGAYIPVKKNKKSKKIKTASVDSIDSQPHIAHFKIIDGQNEYIDEAYPDDGEDHIQFAIKIIKDHELSLGGKSSFIPEKKTIVISEKSSGEMSVPNLFVLVNFSSDEISAIREKI